MHSYRCNIPIYGAPEGSPRPLTRVIYTGMAFNLSYQVGGRRGASGEGRRGEREGGGIRGWRRWDWQSVRGVKGGWGDGEEVGILVDRQGGKK